MSTQYSYHLAINHKSIASSLDKDDFKNNGSLLNLNSVSPVLISNTKNFINYYYDYIHSEIFNVKNSAYYNQLTRSVNFLNNEISNNWTNDITTLASINNFNISNNNSVQLLNEQKLYLTNTWNTVPRFYELDHSLYSDDNNTINEDLKTKDAIKDLITYNNIKQEKIIEDNLKKSYERNIYSDLKTKSISHNSLHKTVKNEPLVVKEQTIELKTKDNEEQMDDYSSHPNYVFGYGSLINPDSRGCTVDSTRNARVIKALVKGLDRSWNYNCRNTYTAVGVSKVDDKSISCNGVIVPIDDPVNDLPKLDEREHDYKRVQLSRSDIEIIHDERNKNVKDEELLPSDAIIWVYAIVDNFTPTTDIPISQIYIDCILLGCIKEGGIEFAKQFIENTHGWNTNVWVNDRTSEYFRKNISRCIVKLTDEIVSSIDSLLTNNLCIDVNQRIIPAY